MKVCKIITWPSILFLLLISTLLSCSEDTQKILSPISKTGKIVINITWPQNATKRAGIHSDVEKITAYIYKAGKEITHKDLRHEGNYGIAEIEVAAGDGYRIGLVAMSYFVLYVGLNEDIDVIANDTTTVDIIMVDAVPTLYPAEMVGDNSFTISWNQVPLVTSYVLRENTSNDFSDYSKLNIYSETDTTITITDKTAGVYYYCVQVKTQYGETRMSDVIMVKVGGLGTISIKIPWPEEQ